MNNKSRKGSQYKIGVDNLARILQECLRRYALEFVVRPGSSKDPCEFSMVGLEDIVLSLADHVDSSLSVDFLTHTLCFFALGTFEHTEKDVIYLKNSFKALLEFRLKKSNNLTEIQDSSVIELTSDSLDMNVSGESYNMASKDSHRRPQLDTLLNSKKQAFIETASEMQDYRSPTSHQIFTPTNESIRAKPQAGGSRPRTQKGSFDYSSDKPSTLKIALSNHRLPPAFEAPSSLFNVYNTRGLGSPKRQHEIYKATQQPPQSRDQRLGSHTMSNFMDSAQEKLERARERFGEAATITEQDLQNYRQLKEAPAGKAPPEYTLRSMGKEGLDVKARQKTLQVLNTLKRSDQEWYHLPQTDHDENSSKGTALGREPKEFSGLSLAGRPGEQPCPKPTHDIMKLLDKTKGNLAKPVRQSRLGGDSFKAGQKN